MASFCLKLASLRWPLFQCGRLLLVLLLVESFANSGSAVYASDRLIGQPAPQFARKGLHGEDVSLANYRGKVVLLNFWATWCAPCRAELPRFDLWQTKYKAQGFQAIAVAMDDDPALPRGVVAKLHLQYPVVIGDSQLGDLYGGVFGFPVTYLIDRDGIVRKRFEGETKPDQLEQEIRNLLPASPR
jgi:thiol-disulfide isomerase/thioredoxin